MNFLYLFSLFAFFSNFRIKGIKSLRVVDASVIPSLPSGTTYIPTIMVAEKAADLIKEAQI